MKILLSSQVFQFSDNNDELINNKQILDVGQKINNTIGASNLTFSKVTSRKG